MSKIKELPTDFVVWLAANKLPAWVKLQVNGGASTWQQVELEIRHKVDLVTT